MRWNMNVVCNWTSRVAAVVVGMLALLSPKVASAEVVTLEELEAQAVSYTHLTLPTNA